MNESKSDYPRHWGGEEQMEFLPELKRNIEGSDNFRGNDYSKTFPEFYKILKESGY